MWNSSCVSISGTGSFKAAHNQVPFRGPETQLGMLALPKLDDLSSQRSAWAVCFCWNWSNFKRPCPQIASRVETLQYRTLQSLAWSCYLLFFGFSSIRFSVSLHISLLLSALVFSCFLALVFPPALVPFPSWWLVPRPLLEPLRIYSPVLVFPMVRLSVYALCVLQLLPALLFGFSILTL